MGKCCSCFGFLSTKKSEVNINLTDLKIPNLNSGSQDQLKQHRSHLKIFLKNVEKLPGNHYQHTSTNTFRANDKHHVINKKKTSLTSPTASFKSISSIKNDTSFHISHTTRLENNYADTDCHDYENFEFDQFNSPEFHLIGTNSFDKDKNSLNDDSDCHYISSISHGDDNNSSTMRQFYLNQINQVNVDGFEWDLI